MLKTESFRVQFPSGERTVRLAGIVDRPLVGEGNAGNPIVVFSHCFTCNKDLKATVRISRALARSGVTVLRFDMTGLGGSHGDFSQTNFTTNLADLQAAIEFAQSELGPVTGLIGHSFGGLAALVTAARHHSDADLGIGLEHLGAVITLAAPSDTQHLASLLARMNPKIESEGVGQVSIGGIAWEVQRQMLDDFRGHDVTKWIPEIRCPVLLMHSPEDETVGLDHALRIMGLLNGADRAGEADRSAVSLVALDGADHLLVADPNDLKFVAETMAAFLNRYARATVA